jgi:hypothetical protein
MFLYSSLQKKNIQKRSCLKRKSVASNLQVKDDVREQSRLHTMEWARCLAFPTDTATYPAGHHSGMNVNSACCWSTNGMLRNVIISYFILLYRILGQWGLFPTSIKVDGNPTCPVHQGDRKTRTTLRDLIFWFKLAFMTRGMWLYYVIGYWL